MTPIIVKLVITPQSQLALFHQHEHCMLAHTHQCWHSEGHEATKICTAWCGVAGSEGCQWPRVVCGARVTQTQSHNLLRISTPSLIALDYSTGTHTYNIN